MKKSWMVFLFLMLLSGCGAEDTFETMADMHAAPAMAETEEIFVALPEGVVPVLENDQQQIYQWGDSQIAIETMASGDLQKTIRSVCGFDREALTVLKTRQEDTDRYEFVWASVSEAGEQLGRAVILDDGTYHYCLSVLGSAETGTEVWEPLCSSFCLV